MARIRSIKPEYWEDEKIGSCSILARFNFVGLWSLADDEGRGRASAVWLTKRLHGYSRDIDEDDVRASLEELAATGSVVFYHAHGEKFYWLKNFTLHQKIDHPTKSKLPAPPLGEGSRALAKSSGDFAQEWNGREGSGVERNGSGVERNGGEGIGEGAPSGSATAPPPPPPEHEEKFTMASVAAEIGVELPGPCNIRHGPPTPEEIRERNRKLKAQLAAQEGITVEELERRGAELAARESAEELKTQSGISPTLPQEARSTPDP